MNRTGIGRREFLAASGGALTSFGLWDRLAQARPEPGGAVSPESTEEVETPLCHLRLDRQNGNLVALVWKDPAQEVIQEP
ncbi:MAG TPA: hypothetical protein VEN79_03740, partial [Terriglobia bacterium]|nr:hypothetical protein [Terriglobia bacterium]